MKINIFEIKHLQIGSDSIQNKYETIPPRDLFTTDRLPLHSGSTR